MNKAANPKQLDLAGDLPPERIAAKEVLASASAILAQAADPDEFDWNTDESIILREQRATAAYRNRLGELIIRQRAGWSDDGDTFLYISPENEVAFMEGLAKRARE
jgi:hypothetical protein